MADLRPSGMSFRLSAPEVEMAGVMDWEGRGEARAGLVQAGVSTARAKRTPMLVCMAWTRWWAEICYGRL